MQIDRYDNTLGTISAVARDHYIDGVDRVLSGAAFMMQPFEAAIKADSGFALGYCGLARAAVLSAQMDTAKSAIATAKSLSEGLSAREKSHINAIGLLLAGKSAQALTAVRAHVAEYPRDALIAQLATSVFGLIGFSGLPGRESELLAYTASLLPHYGDDWWMLSQHAFSYCETGQLGPADKMIERSLAIKPGNSHGAHVRSHVYYEAGDIRDGIEYLESWLPDYDRAGLMHGHISWHVALWALETGDMERMWRTVDADVRPGGSQGLPINILTDTASILYRAEGKGEVIEPERWQQISDYAARCFPNPAQHFIDMHAALAHAMAGRFDLLERYITDAKGPAAEMVSVCAAGFAALAKGDWAKAVRDLSKVLQDDARLGGSRAQRDLLEFCFLNAMLRLGKGEEGRLILSMRRPVLGIAAE